jgi:hypothetical protein
MSQNISVNAVRHSIDVNDVAKQHGHRATDY